MLLAAIPWAGRALLALPAARRRAEGRGKRCGDPDQPSPPHPPSPRRRGEGGWGGRAGGLNHEFRVILFSFLYVMLVLGGIGLWEVLSQRRLWPRPVRVPISLPLPVRRSRRRSLRWAVHRD